MWPNLQGCFEAWYRMYPCCVPLGIWYLSGLGEGHTWSCLQWPEAALHVRLQMWWLGPRKGR